jgi:hypothetical protein
VLETPHVIVGAAIATKISNPALAIPLAFTSHFVLEKVPHWNPHLDTELKKFGKVTQNSIKIMIVDSSIALLSGFYIASLVLPNLAHAATIIAACFFASLPDVLEIPHIFFHAENKLVMWWFRLQKSIQEDAPIIPGLATQVIVVIAALWWISL